MADRQFGIPEGIEKRLAYWANQLSRDKKYPWVGTGLIDDLKCASKLLGAEDFDKLYPLDVGQPKPPQPAEEEDEFAAFYAAKPQQPAEEEDEFTAFYAAKAAPAEYDL